MPQDGKFPLELLSFVSAVCGRRPVPMSKLTPRNGDVFRGLVR